MTNYKEKILSKEFNGVPVVYFFTVVILSTAIFFAGKLEQTGVLGSFSFMWSIGFILYAIGEKLPIWKDYVGGGMIMAFIGSSLMVYGGVISKSDANLMASYVIDNKFLYFLLMALIAASILSIPRKIFMKSIVAYIPMILGSLTGAVLLGIFAGWIIGVDPGRIISHYVLPIMGGGNGAGAIPMAEIYADKTGLDKSEFYSYAVSILTLANIVAVLYGSLLNKVGHRFPGLSGNGQLMISSSDSDHRFEDKYSIAKGDENTMGALFIIMAMMLTCLVLYAFIPAVHVFAWAVIVVMAVSFSNLITESQRRSVILFSEWGMRVFLILVLVTVGLITDINQLLDALSLGNLLITVFIVSGGVLGAGVIGRLMGCYPIESAICAGLCMANRGGTGDIEVLSAAKRMNLFPYAQVSSRIGGAIVLTLAGYLFGVL